MDIVEPRARDCIYPGVNQWDPESLAPTMT